MKISEITTDNLINYLRLSPEEIDEKETDEVRAFLETAKQFIYSYTGLTPEEADNHEDFTIAVYVLVQDMYGKSYTKAAIVFKNGQEVSLNLEEY